VLISLGLPTDRLPACPQLASAGAITTIAQRAESAGYDAVYVTDHPFPPQPYVTHGGHHSLDPFVALSFAAAATTTLRVQTNLLILSYRNPFVTAHGIATLDSLSGGRTIIGVGAGYLEPEFDALGASFDGRGARTDEVLEAMVAAWRGGPTAFEGSDFRAVENVLQPLPLQQPHPPLLVGGNSTAAIRRAVAYAEGWMPMPSPARAAKRLGTPGIESIDELAVRIGFARQLCDDAGRPPLQVWFSPWKLSGFGDWQWDPAPLRDELTALAEIGVEGLTIMLPGTSVDGFVGALDRFAADIIH
jgi:probable F420-dependent oxidoreductase